MFSSSFLLVYYWNENVTTSIISLIFFAISVCTAAYETLNLKAFKTKNQNRIVFFILGVLHVYSSLLIRELHFTYHKYTHIPGKGPEISFGDKSALNILSNLPICLSWISGFPLKTGGFVRLIMWNMTYHAEHHAFSAVPYHSFPRLSKKLENDLIHVQSHNSFHKDVIKQIVSRKA